MSESIKSQGSSEKVENIPCLTTEEVSRLTSEGKINRDDSKNGKSYGRIIADNLLTFFNLVWAIVAIVLMAFGSFGNLTFMVIVVPNVVIAIVQEIRAKKIVDKLSVTTEPHAKVLRGGELVEIDAEAIVLGDTVYIEMGNQILADGQVLSGMAEVNESMLTGESNAVQKNPGDKLFAGSFLVGGACYMRVTSVGKDNYVHKLEKAAKSFKAPQSNLFRDLNNLIKYIGIFMVPMTVMVALSNWFNSKLPEGERLTEVVEATAGAIVAMIPNGIYLLITLTLTLSVILLAKKRTLVQDMYSIEMLASADIVCLDKTGTITDGTMQVTACEPLADINEAEIGRIMAMVEGAELSINNTSRALIEKFGKNTDITIKEQLAFNSARKYSAVTIEGEGTYAIGAAGFVKCPLTEEIKEKIAGHTREGERVLLLVKQPDMETPGSAIALIAITDRIRPNARETIARFQEQGVTVKVISGDHPETVATIAKRVGVLNSDRFLSCENLSDEELTAVANDYSVYGRVSPEQKVLLVKAFRAAGHTVAMTGDGVNDTLALREADCSVAMADGSDVARKVSKIVLLDSDFGTLPDVVREGRRAINNVRMSSALFLMKTVFSIAMAIFVVCLGVVSPFQPKQLMFLELFVIGIASLALTIEPNNNRIEGSFIKTVLIKSIPNAIALAIPVFLALILEKVGFIETSAVTSGICTLGITLAGFINLIFICRPYTKWRTYVVLGVGVLLSICLPGGILLLDVVRILPGIFEFKIAPAFENLPALFITLAAAVVGALVIHIGKIIYEKIRNKVKA